MLGRHPKNLSESHNFRDALKILTTYEGTKIIELLMKEKHLSKLEIAHFVDIELRKVSSKLKEMEESNLVKNKPLYNSENGSVSSYDYALTGFAQKLYSSLKTNLVHSKFSRETLIVNYLP